MNKSHNEEILNDLPSCILTVWKFVGGSECSKLLSTLQRREPEKTPGTMGTGGGP